MQVMSYSTKAFPKKTSSVIPWRPDIPDGHPYIFYIFDGLPYIIYITVDGPPYTISDILYILSLLHYPTQNAGFAFL